MRRKLDYYLLKNIHMMRYIVGTTFVILIWDVYQLHERDDDDCSSPTRYGSLI